MGWTYTHKESGTSVSDFFKHEWSGCTFHGIKVVNMRTAYMAVSTQKNPSKIFAIVCLLGYKKKDYYNFGYKDMDETMGPYNYDCPQSILDMLTPTDNEHANDWRARCQANIDKKKILKFKEGMKIHFPKGVGPWTSGKIIHNFIVQSVKPLRFKDADSISHWLKIPKWIFESQEFSVVS